MNAKKNWINETENSLGGLKAVDVNPYLYSKIVNRLNEKIEKAPAKLVWGTAVSFIILVVLNIFILKSSRAPNQNNHELQATAKQFQLMNDNSINYN